MLWPSRIDYTQAIGFFPDISILDPTLRGGNPRRGSNNYLIVYSGGFSTVFPVEVLSNTYALRCWIADIGDAETRYKEISDYLKQYSLPYFVDFAYVPEGILVNGIKYPITRMEWAEGETLCDFIKQNLQDDQCLKTAAAEFQKMVETLHTHRISHGDLQDGNILLKRNGADVEIKLIDYDSLFVPALRGQPDNIVGLPEYQHAQRMAGGGSASEKVDYFSELVIYLSLLSLAEKPDLWSRFGDRTERGLLFTAGDFKNPDQADVFRELESLSPDVKQLASKLKEFCKRSVDQLEPLEAILPSSSPAQIIYDQGLVYLHSNRYSEAIVEFEKAIGLDPNYKEVHHGLGLAHLKMGNLGEAKKAAEAALRIAPSYQPARALLDVIKSSTPPVNPPPQPQPAQVAHDQGLAYFRSNRYNEAVVEFEKAIGLDPNYKEAHHRLGLVHLKMGNLGEAKKAAEAALRIAPSYQPARALLDAIKFFKPPPPKPPPGPVSTKYWQYTTGALAFILLICIVALTIQISEKDQVLRRANQTFSNEKTQLLRENQKLQNQLTEQNRETRTQMAIVQQLQREKEELLRQKRKLQTENDTLRRQLNTQRSTPDPLPRNDEQFRAEPLQKIYYNTIPPVRTDAIYKNSLGCDAFDRGQHGEAIALFQDAKERDLTSSVVRYNLGSTYLVMEEYIKARNYLQEVVILNPNFKEAHYNLALTQLRRGYPQEAKKAAQAALNIDKSYQPACQLLDYLKWRY